ncbi:hypothetical protein HZA45_00685 [Candidatus Peregrinibacteria bacterium]|nr:hypothetical protein [Candidatus Peregrinibacteria bacterium]
MFNFVIELGSTPMNEIRVQESDWDGLPRERLTAELKADAEEADRIALGIKSNADLLLLISCIEPNQAELLEEVLMQASGDFGTTVGVTDALGVLISLRELGGVLTPEQIDQFELLWDARMNAFSTKDTDDE